MTTHNQAQTIKDLLAQAGILQKDIARGCDSYEQAVWAVIHGRMHTPKIKEGICRMLGAKLGKYYDPAKMFAPPKEVDRRHSVFNVCDLPRSEQKSNGTITPLCPRCGAWRDNIGFRCTPECEEAITQRLPYVEYEPVSYVVCNDMSRLNAVRM